MILEIQDATLHSFTTHFRLATPAALGGAPPSIQLEAISRAFAQIPYENLTKVIARSQRCGETAFRLPDEVLLDHFAHGTGGTCFSLTAAMLAVLRSLGWRAEPILADRHYGADTHCALLVWVDGVPHLLDPGYLILQPVRIDVAAATTIHTAFSELRLEPLASGARLQLSTVQKHGLTPRLTYKTAAVDPGDFQRAWARSFDWDMMRYPVLTCVAGDSQIYLQGRRLQRRDHTGATRRELSDAELTTAMKEQFGIEATIAARALRILEKQGEFGGRTTPS